MIETRYITWRGSQVAEGLANGHSFNAIGRIFYLAPLTMKRHAQLLYEDLGISGMSSTRRRATSMMIAAGLFKASDEKKPYELYAPTMRADEDALIQIKKSNLSSSGYIQPGRNIASEKGITLSPLRLTYLSYATWGLSIRRISELHPWCKDPENAFRHASKNIKKTYELLGAVDGPQAIAHAHHWGALKIDPRVLDPTIIEPPHPFVYEDSVTIPFERFAHRLPLELDGL